MSNALNRKVRSRLAACMLTGVGMALTSGSAFAAIVDSGAISIAITPNINGLYLNLVTGASGNASVTGWDLNVYAATAPATPTLTFFTSSSASNNNQVVAAGTTIAPLTSGTTIGPASTFGTAGVINTVGTTLRQTGTSFIGIRFTRESSSTLHYGYAEISTTAPLGFPATLIRYVYEDTPNTAITIGGAGVSAPAFAYTPTAGSTIAFSGGGAVGSTASASIAASVATAGSGTGASATTTTTCTAPTAPFTGFAQSITAEGTGAITGSPLSGTCTLGATAATQTLTCSENRGGTPTAVTFTLSCPAGTQPPLTSSPASNATLNLPLQALGSASTSSPITFQNPGSLAATVTCTAPAATQFTVSPLSLSVPASGSASLTVTFNGTTPGSFNGQLNCTANGQPFVFNLTGQTLLAKPAFIPVDSPWALGLMIALMGLFAGIVGIRRKS